MVQQRRNQARRRYPKEWENQSRRNRGWKRNRNGLIQPRIGGKWRVLANIFANPDLPEIGDYYEPFTLYPHLQTAPELEARRNLQAWRDLSGDLAIELSDDIGEIERSRAWA